MLNNYQDINCYGKRQVRRKDIKKLENMQELPEMPEDTTKTYVLKLVQGEIQWVEEE